MQKHIFEGDFYVASHGPSAGTPKSSGMHSEVGMRSGRVRIKSGTEKTHCAGNPEVYEAVVERRNENNGGWTMKKGNGGKSTIFPSSWSKGRTLEEDAYA